MYHLTEIQNFKILKSYKTYRGAERAHNNCILSEERRNKLEKLGMPFVV